MDPGFANIMNLDWSKPAPAATSVATGAKTKVKEKAKPESKK